MRLRSAGLIASAQRSMSLKAARERPQITAFFARLAISCTAAEVAVRGDREARLDDVDAHGVEQFGDFDLLLVGHRGAGALLAVAQRRVEDDDAVLLGLGGGHRIWSFLIGALSGAVSDRMRPHGRSGVFNPLSAQAHAPDRPSGADKKEVQNKGESRLGRSPRSDRADIAANRHSATLCMPFPRSPGMVNRALPRERRDGGVLADNRAADARREYVSKDDHFWRAILLAGQAALRPRRAAARRSMNFARSSRTETSMGHVTQARSTGCVAELAPHRRPCAAPAATPRRSAALAGCDRWHGLECGTGFGNDSSR